MTNNVFGGMLNLTQPSCAMSYTSACTTVSMRPTLRHLCLLKIKIFIAMQPVKVEMIQNN